MQIQKKNIPLIIALTIPVLMVVLIAASIYLPVLFIPAPAIDFVFSAKGDYYSQHKYSVQNEKIIKNEVKYPPNAFSPPYSKDPKLFYYDVARDTAREITFEQAQGLSLDNRYTSSDGFEVVSGNYGGDIFFFAYDSSPGCKKYLKKGAFSRKLNLNDSNVDGYNCYNFQFLGWVKTK